VLLSVPRPGGVGDGVHSAKIPCVAAMWLYSLKNQQLSPSLSHTHAHTQSLTTEKGGREGGRGRVKRQVTFPPLRCGSFARARRVPPSTLVRWRRRFRRCWGSQCPLQRALRDFGARNLPAPPSRHNTLRMVRCGSVARSGSAVERRRRPRRPPSSRHSPIHLTLPRAVACPALPRR